MDYIVLAPYGIRSNIIKKREEYYNYNIKFMTLEEFVKRYTFDYDNKTIYYLMKEYNIKYSTALVYLDNLYYISDKIDNDKMSKLKEIKEYLDSNNLLIYDDLFRSYVKKNKVYIYGYDYINKYYLSVIKDLDYEVIEYKYNNYDIDNIYEFNYIDEEVIFVIDRICDLLRNGVSINKIRLIISNEYRSVIYRLFKIYNIPISVRKRSIYSIREVKNVLDNLDNVEEVLLNIYNEEVKSKVIKVLNRYSFIKDKSSASELIINDLKNTYLEEDTTGIKVSSIDDYFDDDTYVFLLGFNKENIPMLYKDQEYFSDKDKNILGYDSSNELNINKRIEVIRKLHNIKNLTISYKLNDSNGVYTSSDLLLGVNIINDYKHKYINSDMMNKIFLANSLDDLVKYNVKDEDLDLLSSNYDIPYMNYDNSYNKIDKDKLYKYLDNKLVLSYTALENYYKCSFKYYLNNKI